jgi:hypothetical protein
MLALAIVASCSGLFLAAQAQGTTATIDFDTGTPALTTGQNVPLDQTAGGVSAHFSSPQGTAFSVQTDVSTSYTLSAFSGHYLNPNNRNRNALDIFFNQPLTSITLTFATAENTAAGELTTAILMTAFLNSTNSAAIGQVSATPVFSPTDTYPSGTITFSSLQPFNLLELRVPTGGTGGIATDLLVDNINFTTVPEPGSVALFSAALGLFSLRMLARKRRGNRAMD